MEIPRVEKINAFQGIKRPNTLKMKQCDTYSNPFDDQVSHTILSM